ncbi:hypothetical protein D7Y36_19525 [Stenotrophomonas maltophilia]|nr:hypothetical protein [Stenotrophomonas maltophilia]QBL45516.1 hypothetical protein LBG_13375 [Stenotrophomonas maltophilia]
MSAGLRPAPVVVPAAGRQPQQQQQQQQQQRQRAFRRMAGRCRSAGALQVRPCKLGSRIHAADTPPSDTAPPLTDSGGCWCLSTLVDTVDPRHAWMHFDSNSKYSIPMEIHPRMAWIYCRSRRSVEGGVGPVAGA